jgi:hypothetical protein
MAAAPVAAPAPITPIENCLPNFIEGGAVVAWKRKLFYMLGYCDTYHDFHVSRLKDGNKSEEKAALIYAVKSVGSLSEYIKKVIKQMDGGFGWEENIYKPINDFITTKNKYSFENAMFDAFTKTVATLEGDTKKNTLAEKMGDGGKEYMEYLHQSLKIKQTQILDIQILTMKDFQDGVPDVLSSIIELEMPAVLTQRDKISKNLQEFLHKCYINNIKNRKIQFVEDTASFPRSIFDGFPAQRDAFMKIVTTQTQWDPAGVSDYHPNKTPALSLMDTNTKNEKNIAAPSFIAKKKFNSLDSNKFDETTAYFTSDAIYRDGEKIKLTTPSVSKSGPSVNHLLLHMILNTPKHIVTLEQKVSELLENVLRAASLSASKSKNYTFILDKGVNDAAKDQKLRDYTSSKRSGDYENIHSAKFFNALMFTGDEPAFTYGVMNQYPIVYHLKSEVKHYFRFYIPPTNPLLTAIYENQKDLRDYVHKATELDTIFGTSIAKYTTLFNTTIDTKLNKDIQITGAMASRIKDCDKMLGEVFKGVLVNNILKIENIIENILAFQAVKENLDQTKKDYIAQINVKLAALSTINSTKLNTDATVLDNFNTIKRELNAIFGGLSTEIKAAETNLSDVRDIIPHKFKGNTNAQDFQFYTLFESVDKSQSCFTDDTGSYKLNEIKILPDMPKTVNLAFKELAKLALNFERGGRVGGGYDFIKDIVVEMADILKEIGCVPEIVSVFNIDTLRKEPDTNKVLLPTVDDIKSKYDYKDKYRDITNKFLAAAEAAAAPVTAASGRGRGRGGMSGGRGGRDRNNFLINRQQFVSPNIPTYMKPTQTVRSPKRTNHNEIFIITNNNTRKRNRNQGTTIVTNTSQQGNTHVELNEAFYKSLYNEIIKNMNGIKPFGLTAEEYAASIVYRCAIVDKLHDFFYPNGSPVQDKVNEQTPQPAVVQSGGAVGDEEKEILLYIQNEVLSPFLEKYFIKDDDNTFFVSFLNKVYDGSFVPDYIDVLDELIGMNEQLFIDTYNRAIEEKRVADEARKAARTAQTKVHDQNSKTQANTEFNNANEVFIAKNRDASVAERIKNGIQSIKDEAQLAKKTLITLPSKKRIRLKHRRGEVNMRDFNTIITNFKSYPNLEDVIIDTSIENIRKINNYVIRIFESEDGPEVNINKVNDIFCKGYEPGSQYNKTDYDNALQDYLHSHFKSYLELMYPIVPEDEGEVVAAAEAEGLAAAEAAAAAAEAGAGGEFNNTSNLGEEGVNGGSRKTRRRARATKQRKSKRRVPRRKRNNK